MKTIYPESPAKDFNEWALWIREQLSKIKQD
jgi:hypothetical protein